MTAHRIPAGAAIVALIALAAGCSSDSAGPNGRQLSLSFTTAHGSSASSASVRRAAADLTQTVGSNTLVISKAQVVMKRIELANAATTDCTADAEDGDLVMPAMAMGMGGDGGGHDGPECDEIRADPAVVDLPTDAAVTTSFVSTVPAGTYSAFEAKIHTVMGHSHADTEFLMNNPTFAGVSVHVEGTYNGTPFSYDGHARAKLFIPLSPPVTTTTSGLNITVNVDLSTWFLDGSGALIDPSTANSGGANETLVAQNIHESFEAFEDDDHDGRHDHDGH